MALLETGIYTITNVKFENLAVLQDTNDGSEIVGRPEEDHAGEKVCWKVRTIQRNVIRLYSVERHTTQKQEIYPRE
jgi:hypothetical protein